MFGEDVQTALNQVLRFGEGDTGLVRVIVSVWLKDMSARLQFVPECEIPRLPARVSERPRRDDIELRPQPILLEEFHRLQRGLPIAVIPTQRKIAHRLPSVFLLSGVTPCWACSG